MTDYPIDNGAVFIIKRKEFNKLDVIVSAFNSF